METSNNKYGKYPDTANNDTTNITISGNVGNVKVSDDIEKQTFLIS